MIGNDLVDLRAREAAGKAGNARFVKRVFTAREAELIALSVDPDYALWMLWAAKEAAYKVARKLAPDVIFAHSRYEVNPEDDALLAGEVGSSLLRSGRVVLRGLEGLDGACFPVEWRLSPTFVHCVAMDAEGDFRSLRTAISARGEIDRGTTTYEPTERERASLAGRSEESLAVRRLGRALAAEAGLGDVEIVRERQGATFGPPRLYARGSATPLEGWDITLSHDGELAAVVLVNDGTTGLRAPICLHSIHIHRNAEYSLEVQMGAASNSYLLIFRESTPERYDVMTREERRRALADWNAWCDRLAAQGKLQSGHPLLPEGRVVSSAATSRRVDGPFAEAKEMIGGYFFLHAESMDEAIAIAEESPNLQHGQTVEVRPIAEGCHLARSLGLRGMREPADAPTASSGNRTAE